MLFTRIQLTTISYSLKVRNEYLILPVLYENGTLFCCIFDHDTLQNAL